MEDAPGNESGAAGTDAAEGIDLAEEAVRQARRRVWAAQSACYYAHSRYAHSRYAHSRYAHSRYAHSRYAHSRYAHSRYARSGSEADRLLWLARNREADRAATGLQEAERALATARGGWPG